jgi:elongation factor P
MKQNANLMRPGWVIDHNGKMYSILSYNIVKPGKGGAFINVTMRDIESGSKTEERFRTEDTVEKLMVEEKDCQFLFREGDNLTFMHKDTYEQFQIPADYLGEQIAFLTDGMDVSINFIEGKPISATLPNHVKAKIDFAEPTVKGQTAASSYKPAVLENGVRIMVPPFIDSGEEIIVNTEDLTYVERAK